MSIGTSVLGNFVPTDAGAMALWLDAADASTLTLSGNLVTQWNDKSGNARHFSNISGAGQPTYSATGFNTSYPTLSFATNTYLSRTTSGSAASLYTAFFVLDATTTAGQYLFDVETGRFVIAQRETVGTGVYNGSTWYSQPAQAGLQIYSFVCTSGGGLFRNGMRFGTITTFTGLALNLRNAIGCSFPITTNFFNGKLSEFILFSSALSDTSRQQVEAYLAQKWGILSVLPIAHPYKYSLQISTNLSGGFSPRSVSGCVCWLDAADTSVFTGGTTWVDKSGTGNNAINGTAGISTMPTVTTWSNGLRAARFVQASKNSMKTTNTIPNVQMTYFIVFRIQAAVGNGWIMINNIDGQRQLYTGPATSFPVTPRTHALSTDPLNLVPLNQGQGCFWCGTISGNQYLSYPFGVLTGVGGVEVSSPSVHYFGSGNGDSGYVSIDIAEIIIYNNIVSTQDRQEVEGYLAWKWGLQGNLPPTHPYVSQDVFLPTVIPYNYSLTIASSVSYFNPLSISGGVAWFDAADTSTFVFEPFDNTVISSWANKVNGITSINSASDYDISDPILLTSGGLNGKQSVLMGGGRYFTGGVTVSGTTVSCFAVAMTTASQPRVGVDQRLISMGTVTSSDSDNAASVVGLFNQLGTSTIQTYRNSTSISSTPIAQNVPFVAESIYDGTNGQVWKDGFAGTGPTGSIGTFGIAKIRVGSVVNSYRTNNFWNGYIGEILIYNTALTQIQRQAVEGYLAWKWGLQGNLPANHSFKLFPPPP